MRADDGVSSEYEGRLAARVVDLFGVDVAAFALGRFQDIGEGPEGFGGVFGEGAGDDFEVVEADLWLCRLLLGLLSGSLHDR